MSNEVATYTFLPWLRQGIANNISSKDFDDNVKQRVGIEVSLDLIGEGLEEEPTSNVINIKKNIELYGPGDIVGIDSNAIVKTEPRNWITNFESNYLSYIEFYDEDFPWRYTPASPDGDRLRPWIMLVVLKEDEFEDGKNIKDKPLPFIELLKEPNEILPDAEQLWAWAHVHVNRDIRKNDQVVTNDLGVLLPNLEDLLDTNPDLAYSRVMCPRKLKENEAYHAFLIPVFESGRLAGLGLDPSGALNATTSAWAGAADLFPYYHRWYFRTGSVGDFEYLVRLLEAKPVDSRVGKRDMDVQTPGSNIQGIRDEELGGILKLGGALRIPVETLNEEERVEVKKYDEWSKSDPHPFQEELAGFINLSEGYSKKKPVEVNLTVSDAIASDPDPLITSPLYGQWHALTQRLLKEEGGEKIDPDDNWVHELNLDPRWRVPAGFGTKIIQDKQEEYMDTAWDQVGDVLEANRKIRQAQMAKLASLGWYEKYLKPLKSIDEERYFKLTTPMNKRILSDGFTVHHQVNLSTIPNVISSVAMRQIMRPRARLMRSLSFNEEIRPSNLLDRINREEVSAAPQRVVPESLITLKDLSDGLKPDNIPKLLWNVLKKHPWMPYLPLIFGIVVFMLVLVTGLGGLALTAGGIVSAGALYTYSVVRKWGTQAKVANTILEENLTPESVDELPKSPNFRLSEPGDGFIRTIGNNDSEEGIRYKSALRDAFKVIQVSAEVSKKTKPLPLDLSLMLGDSIKQLHPALTIPRYVYSKFNIPKRIMDQLNEKFTEVMVYPKFDLPMYKPLAENSSERLLPGINFIEQNSISLLETNQRFIESYMVGLNHEFARELLWREFPTDQRGSYFRQFWDPSGSFNNKNLSDEDFKEKLKDIPPLHLWSRYSKLGDHDHREKAGDKEEEAVLVIRGELLKKYPTAVIYAHRAEWQKNDQGNITGRSLVELTEENKLLEDTIKMPLYEAKVEPDIYFFGFDLTAIEARGDLAEDDNPDPGWFFIIKERPGEPRFGLDIVQDEIEVQGTFWNDLSWGNVLPGDAGGHIKIKDINFNLVNYLPLSDPPSSEDNRKSQQNEEDKQLSWNMNSDAAELAYILYQVPVLIAVHASEMLTEVEGLNA